MEKQKMIHIRLDSETYKGLGHICVEKETSIQKYIEGLIKDGIKNEKM